MIQEKRIKDLGPIYKSCRPLTAVCETKGRALARPWSCRFQGRTWQTGSGSDSTGGTGSHDALNRVLRLYARSTKYLGLLTVLLMLSISFTNRIPAKWVIGG